MTPSFLNPQFFVCKTLNTLNHLNDLDVIQNQMSCFRRYQTGGLGLTRYIVLAITQRVKYCLCGEMRLQMFFTVVSFVCLQRLFEDKFQGLRVYSICISFYYSLGVLKMIKFNNFLSFFLKIILGEWGTFFYGVQWHGGQ